MSQNDVIFNIRERGGRAAARTVDHVGDSYTRLGRNVRGGTNNLRLFSRASVSTTGHLRLMGGAALYGGAAIGGVLALGIKKAITEYEDARTVVTSTNAVIKSTAGVANVTAREVDALSMSLSRKSGIDDEAIARGENMLLTFRKIRNEVGAGNDIFTQAARASVDLAAGLTAMGKPTTVTAASTLLGKALNDPVRGATALGRTGAIDKSAVERIKEMDKAGASLRTLQKFVLNEVNAQFGGQASATATPLKKLGVGIANIEESIGKGLSPATDAIAVKLGKLADDAAPKFDALGHRLEHIFDRNDLNFTQKLGLSASSLSHTLRPYERQIGREIKHLHLGEKFADGIEYAIPRMANAAANAAPHAAEAFLKGWLHAGVWGKLLTLGLLERKLGLFSLLGVRASGRFTTSFVASQAAERPAYTALGTRLGRFMGPAMGIAAAAYIALELQKKFGDAFTDILGLPTDSKIAVDTNPRVIKGRQWAQFLTKNPDLQRDWLRKAGPGGRQAHETFLDLAHGSLKGSPGMSRRLESYLRNAGDPMFWPRSPKERHRFEQVNHITLKVDGKVLAKAVRRSNDDDDARR